MYNLILVVQNTNTKQYFKVVVNTQTLQATVISVNNFTVNVSLNTVAKRYYILEVEVERVVPLQQVIASLDNF
jgi:ethanolamine utilization protein EutA (predicted chaperonin)